MKPMLRYALALALSSTAATAFAYEGFDPYADPTLPHAAVTAGRPSGINRPRNSQPATNVGASARAMHRSSAAKQHVVASRAVPIRQRSEPIGADDSCTHLPK
jgi:hypothetical protein